MAIDPLVSSQQPSQPCQNSGVYPPSMVTLAVSMVLACALANLIELWYAQVGWWIVELGVAEPAEYDLRTDTTDISLILGYRVVVSCVVIASGVGLIRCGKWAWRLLIFVLGLDVCCFLVTYFLANRVAGLGLTITGHPIAGLVVFAELIALAVLSSRHTRSWLEAAYSQS